MTIDAPDHYPEVLKELADHFANLLAAHGIDPDKAEEIGRAAAEFLREHWGGQNVYLPKGKLFKLSERDLMIWEKWNGRNVLELCREFDITRARLYQILAIVRAREVSKRQMSLLK